VDIQKQYLPKVAKFQPKKIIPSKEQLAIQLSTRKTILIDANAGAAKTTTLALRMAESLARGVAPERMLALCITEAAAQVLAQRLKQIGVAAAVVKKIRCQTFEALAQDILRQIERTSVPYILDQEQLVGVVQDALQRVSERYGQRFALDTQTHNVAVHTFLQMQMRLKARLDLVTHDLEGYQPDEIADVLGVPLTTYLLHLQYENLRGVDEQIHFRAEGDAAYDLMQMLLQEPENIAWLPDYQVIMADELHDLNEVTFRLLSLLMQKGDAYFCGAGDKDQVIYSWRGADHQYLRHRFQATFANLEVYPLTLCYRHGAKLAHMVASFKQKENRSGINHATQIELRPYALASAPDAASVPDCAGATLRAVQDWQASGGKLAGCAILLRSPGQSIRIEQALIQSNIAYRLEAMPPFLQRPEILMLRGMLAVGLRNLASVPLRQVQELLFDAMLLFAEISHDYDDREAWLKDRATAISQPNALEWFLDGVLIRRARHAKNAIIGCRDYLRSLPPDAPAHEALQQVVALLRLGDVTRRVFVDPQQAAMVQESIAEFIQLCRATGLGLQAFCDWLGQAEAAQAQQQQKDALVLACIDDIKGHEYDAVIMPYLARGQFPRSGVPLLEEENRFYVAITRTRLQLVLLMPQDGAQVSPFLARLGL
jgi:DNA helicase-2/ATP-dependent DNA helicase PcrA